MTGGDDGGVLESLSSSSGVSSGQHVARDADRRTNALVEHNAEDPTEPHREQRGVSVKSDLLRRAKVQALFIFWRRIEETANAWCFLTPLFFGWHDVKISHDYPVWVGQQNCGTA